MTMYSLLRNNKQSGPYSLDELTTMGLKAYDLVWVEGKSAAWRYPSEIEELKAFAPAVEEQPFDRFYKKPPVVQSIRPEEVQSAANVVANVSARPVIATADVSAEPIRTSVIATPARPAAVFASTGAFHENTLPNTDPAVLTTEPSSQPGRRIIYVTMPAGKARPSAPAPSAAIAETSRVVSHTPAASVPLTVPLGLDDLVEENSSQSHGEWRQAVERSPRRRRPITRLFQPIAVVLCILALLAAGIFIGLSINKNSLVSGQKIASRENKPAVDRISRTSQQLPPVAPVTASQTSATPTDSSTTKKISGQTSVVGAQQEVRSTAAINHPPKTTTPKTKSAPAAKNSTVLSGINHDSATLGIPVAHREAVHRTDIPATDRSTVDKDILKSNIANLVSVGTSGYTVGTFGGISGLQLTVSNHSVYPLDLVVVEVQYIQANKKVFKTENLYFRGIGPGSALMQEAPKSARGIKVQYKITLVNSKELGLSYSGIN